MTSSALKHDDGLPQNAEREPERHFQMLALVAHELRTPLNSIAGWMSILADESLDEVAKKHGFDAVRRNIDWQKRLIEDLLDAASIKAGKMRVSTAPLVLNRLVADSVETVKPQAVAAKVDLIAAFPEEDLQVLGDDGRLRQVLCNLLHNALKFTPPAGTIEINLAEMRGCAEMTITDTGCGIAPEFLPLVFECWRQNDKVERHHNRGLGLGLNIARSIVESHGGTICANSLGAEQGATFIVRLPLL